MLDESSVFADGKGENAPPPSLPSPVALPPDPALLPLDAVAAEVMDVTATDYHPAAPASVIYKGRLRLDSEMAFARLDSVFAPLNYQAVLASDEDGQQIIMALKGRIQPKARPWWPNLLLLVLTLFSLLYVGAIHEAGLHNSTQLSLWKGWPYALSLIAILGTHELGHYFAARHHHVSVTLPYFIPMPLGSFGTLGAFIQLRAPMPNRKILFDVGVAGPLAGLVVALPILFIGLATSHIEPLPKEAYVLEGDSLLYAVAKLTVFGQFLPNGHEDVFINQLAKAGWTGLFITGLNLIPLGQLDGGHVIYTLFGRRAQRLYMPVLVGFLALSFFNSAWLLWTLLLFLLGRIYAVPLDSVTPLGQRRRWLGYVALVVFALVFVPDPLRLIQP